MKKILYSLCALSSAIFVVAGANAQSSTADLSSSPYQREKFDAEPRKTTTESRRVRSNSNLYYVKKEARENNRYRDFSGCSIDGCDDTPRSVRAESKRQDTGRKYNLGNPFFQPLGMSLMSTTDLSYMWNKVGIDINPSLTSSIGDSGTYSAGMLGATQTLSFGITDDFALTGMFRLSHSTITGDWKHPNASYPTSRDRETISQLDTWGLRAEWRFMNTQEFIANISGEYQSFETASIIAVEAKAGYKNDDTTLYGLARVGYTKYDYDNYGIGVANDQDYAAWFTFKEEISSALRYELGAGLFAAIDGDWSADLRVVWADEDWYNRIYGQLAISYQPWKNAAISLWARTDIWNNVNGFDKSNVWFKYPGDNFELEGTAQFGKWTDMSGGLKISATF